MCRLERVANVVALAMFATITLAAGEPLAAQSVRGTVSLPDSVPAAGVIVAALDRSGLTVNRTLTNEHGVFVLHVPAAGQFHLRLLRIGYRPVDGPSVRIDADRTDTLHLVFAGEPVRLASVSVDAPATCRVNADTGLLVAAVWEEARKAMLSTRLGSAETPLVAEWVEYDRMLDSAGRVVKDQRVRKSRNATTHAFQSASAAELVARGYVVTDSGVTTFHVPDPEVLLSDLFAGSHCFRLERSTTPGPSLLGVAFEPSAERRGMRDIEGTLWLDQSSAELRTLEFRYTNLPDIARAAGAGGDVEFLRLDDGTWLVSRWTVRMPELGTRTPMLNGGPRVVVSGRQLTVRGVKVSGGEVTSIIRRDSVLYESLGNEVVVQVVGGDSLVRPSAAVLSLDGTDYRARANDAGRIELSPVLPGAYRASVRTAAMDALGMPAVVLDVVSGARARVDTVRLPPAGTMLEVIVADVDGEPLPQTSLELQQERGPARMVVTGRDGRVLVRDLAPGTLSVHARRLGYQPGRLTTPVSAGPNVLPIVMSRLSPPTLDTVRVVGSAQVVARLQEFDARRINHRATVSITREDLQKRNPTETWQMLTNVPAMRVIDVDDYGRVIAASTRTPVANFKNEVCYYLVTVDGVPLNATPGHKAVDLRSLPRPDEIYGIEVFAGAASIPVQYSGAGDGKWCGLIAVWTR